MCESFIKDVAWLPLRTGAAWLLMSLWLPDKRPVAPCCCRSDRQLFALVTATSGHLGPSDGGGRRHAKGGADKVTPSLAYWLIHCLTDCFGFLWRFFKKGKKSWASNASMNIKSDDFSENTPCMCSALLLWTLVWLSADCMERHRNIWRAPPLFLIKH